MAHSLAPTQVRPTACPTTSMATTTRPVRTLASTSSRGAPVRRAMRSGRWRRPSWLSATRPGQRPQHVHPDAEQRGQHGHRDGRGRVGALAVPAAVRQVGGVEGELDRPRQPREHAAAQHAVAEQPDDEGGEVGDAGDVPAETERGTTSSSGAEEGEPHRARARAGPARPACRAARGARRARRSTRSLSQPRMAWPDQHGGRHEADLAQRAARQAGGGPHRERRQPRPVADARPAPAAPAGCGRGEKPRRAGRAWVDMPAVSTHAGRSVGTSAAIRTTRPRASPSPPRRAARTTRSASLSSPDRRSDLHKRCREVLAGAC